MNVKLHTPKTLKEGSGLSSAKQFLLSLIATTVSIILTFGTAAIIDHHKKEAAKKEMVMMVINDYDKTIAILEKADSSLRLTSSMQQELAIHPERFDSLRSRLPMTLTWLFDDYTETTEKIFTTSIETFNTIGDVNFVNEVSSFYQARHEYREKLYDKLKEGMETREMIKSLKSLMNVSFPELVYLNWSF